MHVAAFEGFVDSGMPTLPMFLCAGIAFQQMQDRCKSGHTQSPQAMLNDTADAVRTQRNAHLPLFLGVRLQLTIMLPALSMSRGQARLSAASPMAVLARRQLDRLHFACDSAGLLLRMEHIT